MCKHVKEEHGLLGWGPEVAKLLEDHGLVAMPALRPRDQCRRQRQKCLTLARLGALLLCRAGFSLLQAAGTSAPTGSPCMYFAHQYHHSQCVCAPQLLLLQFSSGWRHAFGTAYWPTRDGFRLNTELSCKTVQQFRNHLTVAARASHVQFADTIVIALLLLRRGDLLQAGRLWKVLHRQTAVDSAPAAHEA